MGLAEWWERLLYTVHETLLGRLVLRPFTGDRPRAALVVHLPSFYTTELEAEDMARQSGPSDFDEENAAALPEVAVSRDYKFAHPRLIARFADVKKEYEDTSPGKSLIVTCIYRSPTEQRRLHKQGRYGNPGPVVTNCDGFTKKSRHNTCPSTALDVAVLIGGKVTWDEVHYYKLGPLCNKYGLEWGGFFKKIPDMPHIQLFETDCGP